MRPKTAADMPQEDQEIFDFAYEAITRQGKPSTSGRAGTRACCYFTPAGSCGLGVILPETVSESVKKYWNASDALSLAQELRAGRTAEHSAVGAWIEKHSGLVMRIQACHDSAAFNYGLEGVSFAESFQRRMKDIARDLRLAVPEIQTET